MKFKAKPKLTPNRLRERYSEKGKSTNNLNIKISLTGGIDRYFNAHVKNLSLEINKACEESRLHMRNLAIQMQSNLLYELCAVKDKTETHCDADFY